MHEVYGTPFDPRYSSLLVPSVRPHRLPPAPGPAASASPCDLGKSEAGATWTGAFAAAGPEMGLNVDAGNGKPTPCRSWPRTSLALSASVSPSLPV